MNIKNLFPRFKLKTKALIVIGTLFLFVIIGLLSRITIDIGNILFSIACIGFVYVIYLYIKYKKEPKRTINITLKSKLIAPIVKFNRYNFHIIIEHEIEEKGESRNLKADELEIKFRKSDHPNIYEWCYNFATKKMNEHLKSVKQEYPDSKITYNPIPTVNALEEVNE